MDTSCVNMENNSSNNNSLSSSSLRHRTRVPSSYSAESSNSATSSISSEHSQHLIMTMMSMKNENINNNNNSNSSSSDDQNYLNIEIVYPNGYNTIKKIDSKYVFLFNEIRNLKSSYFVFLKNFLQKIYKS